VISKVLPLGSARAAASVALTCPPPQVLDDHRQSLRLVQLLRQQPRDDIDRIPAAKPTSKCTDRRSVCALAIDEGQEELQQSLQYAEVDDAEVP